MELHYYICADCGAPIALGDACTCWSKRKPWLGKVLLPGLVIVGLVILWAAL